MLLLMAAGLTPLYHAVSSTGSTVYRYVVLPDDGVQSTAFHLVTAAAWAIALVGVFLSVAFENRKLVSISAVAFAATLTVIAIAAVEFMSAGVNESSGPAFFLLPVAAVCIFIGYRRYR